MSPSARWEVTHPCSYRGICIYLSYLQDNVSAFAAAVDGDDGGLVNGSGPRPPALPPATAVAGVPPDFRGCRGGGQPPLRVAWAPISARSLASGWCQGYFQFSKNVTYLVTHLFKN